MRFIAHLDMDAFYASVELLRYPELRGRPVVIGGRRRTPESGPAAAFPTLRGYAGRGVSTTATYEARALGVHSGMGLMRAARRAPDALLLPADFDEYRRYSRLFKDAVRAVAPQIEDRGIDEIYIDLTELVLGSGVDDAADPWLRARAVAASIQQAVRAATGLSCSIGITHNKLLAKIASDLDKPGGLTILKDADIAARIWPLPVRKLNGIGPKADARLEALGIRTIGDLAHAAPALLVERFGKSYGAWMHEAAHAATSATSSPTASRNRSAGKPRSKPTCTRCATASSSRRYSPSCACGSRAISSAKATSDGRSGSSSDTTTSKPSRAIARSTSRRGTPRRYAARRASASNAWRSTGASGSWAFASVR